MTIVESGPTTKIVLQVYYLVLFLSDLYSFRKPETVMETKKLDGTENIYGGIVILVRISPLYG